MNLEFSPRVAASLDRLKELSDSPSRTDVIRKALSLFDLVLTQREAGGKIVIHRSDGQQETLHLL